MNFKHVGKHISAKVVSGKVVMTLFVDGKGETLKDKWGGWLFTQVFR